MREILEDIGMKPIVPNGGYFMIADASSIKHLIPEHELDDSTDPWDYKGKNKVSGDISKILLFAYGRGF